MNAPYTVTSNDVGQFIKQNVQHPGAVFILVPVDGEKMLLKKDGEDQTDNDSRMQAKVVDTNIDSTDVTKNINENQEDSSIDRKTYELRQNPKQKRRSSYEYDIPSKYKRIYLKKRVNLNHDTNKDSEETVCTSDMTGNISDELPDLGNEPETTEWKPPKTKAEKEKAKLQYIQDRNREIRERLEDHRLELNPHQEHRRHVLACDIYQFFNNILTGNRLKPAAEGLFWSNRLSIDGKRRKMGMTIGNSCLGIVDSIILGDDFHLDPKELYGTMFHEFVHAFVYINQIRDYSAHGSVWQSKVKQLIKKVKQNRDLMPASIKNLPLEIKDIR